MAAGAPKQEGIEMMVGRNACESIRTPGVIRQDEAYTLEELKLRLQIGEHGWWNLRDAGLRTVQLGKGRVILGRHVLEVLDRLAAEREAKASPRARLRDSGASGGELPAREGAGPAMPPATDSEVPRLESATVARRP